LALQAGGSHGAFTWGILDRLLEDPTIDIIGATGTSAGAMNATVLADGMVRGGPSQARTGLRRYWDAVGAMPGFGGLLSNISGEAAAMTRAASEAVPEVKDSADAELDQDIWSPRRQLAEAPCDRRSKESRLRRHQ
jgi:predicted acylesterase/phospholipase RssA